MRLLYFAWVRERIGKTEETVDLPAHVRTGADLLAWLKTRGEEYDHALERPDVIRLAVDQMHVRQTEDIAGAREIALFPPMTGG
ncbi:molybdopterin converting factor subunit 1 [Prosthecodimorpha staleyi]|uniref:Molybdopterin converting factor subunit 1 n=1 Tax=Prosthecodimorpha staleyi TaxID=2840188 RepID=A0A947D1Y5_9HYPH|nr:molybdopterin converting factor subunit 1 [Prosthecodimorpha staleyi]MBT9289201.1 molybdopterin converting factor subunit 1 [Prosthecodimorpha staleyi]